MKPSTMLGAAAVFNFVAGAAFLLAGGPISSIFGMEPLSNQLFTQIVGLAVILFGAGYWLESRQPGRHRSMIALGAVGKVSIFVLAVGHFLAGSINGIFPVLLCADVTWALLFWRYLRAPSGAWATSAGT